MRDAVGRDQRRAEYHRDDGDRDSLLQMLRRDGFDLPGDRLRRQPSAVVHAR